MTNDLPDLTELLPSWQLVLRSERKSPATLKGYTKGVTAYIRWCAATGTPLVLSRANVQQFIADLLDNGMEASTAVARQSALKRFSAWLTAEGEYETDPLLGVKPPKVDRKVVNALTDDDLKRLIKACQGKALTDRRDEAIVRLLAETGMRAGEVLALTVEDVDVHRGLVTIHRGKGGKGRVAPFGPQTATALDRYIRVRRGHRLADAAPLWVGGQDKTFGYHALDKTLKHRAELAGIKGFHLHRMRHTAATRWLRHGGSESGLMSVAGWANRDMIDRYTSASASERAADEARGLNLGDL
ncbi:tyrosine-type recombinase/integrase [Mycobacterium sp. B14F4]|uniref:tyrosine-type recombinase/integrase n=1 Tax=Mycobacterium sp. B14F4 TaxID=3153565 RepID=UPI00325EB66D